MSRTSNSTLRRILENTTLATPTRRERLAAVAIGDYPQAKEQVDFFCSTLEVSDKETGTDNMLRSTRNFAFFIALTFSFSMFAPNLATADIMFSGRGGMVDISLEGSITSDTAEDFIETYEGFRQSDQYFHYTALLDSEGGDIYAAMKIGRYLREHKARIVITGDSKCFSSCVLIYVGSVYRSSFGQLGLHRPYIHAENAAQRSSEEEIRMIYGDVKRYLQEMNINDELYRLMMATPPEEMLVLNWDDERLPFLIPDKDPVYAEVQLQNREFKIGITTSELRRRNAWAKQNCYKLYENAEDMVTCMEAARWGLDVETFRKRSSIAYAACKLEVGKMWESRDECMRHNMSDNTD